MNRFKSTVLTVLVGCAVPLCTLAAGDHKEEHRQADATTASTSMTAGEVKKIDKDNGKITIKHGEIKNLDMPPMTMVFRVKEVAMLEKVKPGDKVNFAADKVNGNLTVTAIEAAK